MVNGILSPDGTGNSPATPKNDPKRIQDAARQFEALLIGQILKSMRESEGGWMGTGDDQSIASAMEYAQEMFAQSLAAGGGLGLARVVSAGFGPRGER